MATINKNHTFSSGAVILASEHNDNFDTIYADYNGNITNANISASAAIANSKLNLSTISQNVDFSGTVDISSTLTFGSTNQGDILYDNGTSIVRLTPGTAGQNLQTGGAGANPSWANGSGQVLTTQGDILYRDGSGLARLAAGTSGQYLQTQGGGANPQWASLSPAGSAFQASSTFSATEPVSVDLTVSADEVYRIVFEGVTATATLRPCLRINNDSAGSNHKFCTHLLANATETIGSSTGDDLIELMDGTDTLKSGAIFHIDIIVTSRNSDTQLTYIFSGHDAANSEMFSSRGSGLFDAGTMTNIRLLDGSAGSGTFTGRYYISKLSTS